MESFLLALKRSENKCSLSVRNMSRFCHSVANVFVCVPVSSHSVPPPLPSFLPRVRSTLATSPLFGLIFFSQGKEGGPYTQPGPNPHIKTDGERAKFARGPGGVWRETMSTDCTSWCCSRRKIGLVGNAGGGYDLSLELQSSNPPPTPS